MNPYGAFCQTFPRGEPSALIELGIRRDVLFWNDGADIASGYNGRAVIQIVFKPDRHPDDHSKA